MPQIDSNCKSQGAKNWLMSVSVSVASFNINWTKNKSLTIHELYSKFDIVCFQESFDKNER